MLEHASVVQARPSLQSGGFPAVQTPELQLSLTVQPSESALQLVPSVLALPPPVQLPATQVLALMHADADSHSKPSTALLGWHPPAPSQVSAPVHAFEVASPHAVPWAA